MLPIQVRRSLPGRDDAWRRHADVVGRVRCLPVQGQLREQLVPGRGMPRVVTENHRLLCSRIAKLSVVPLRCSSNCPASQRAFRSIVAPIFFNVSKFCRISIVAFCGSAAFWASFYPPLSSVVQVHQGAVRRAVLQRLVPRRRNLRVARQVPRVPRPVAVPWGQFPSTF